MDFSKKIKAGICLLYLVHSLQAQTSLATAQLRTLKGKQVSFSSVTQKDSLILVCFWASWSEASIQELNAINANYQKWKTIASFKLIAVCTDEGKSANKIRPLVNMNGWLFDVYSDFNGDLRKELNSNNLPQALLIKRDKVVYQQSGFESGTENYLLEKILAISAGGH
jgi:cytochrome c biogenesis protein CcmG, thiol:disulfide interchange protein DsbE